jgi:Flp pilus assembly protein TadB
MTAGGSWEIPPLDDAPDIARTTESQPGQALADARNWAGFVLLFIGSLVAVVSAAVGVAGYLSAAVVGAIIAIVTVLGGVALIVLERGNARARQNSSTDSQPSATWEAVVPPRA